MVLSRLQWAFLYTSVKPIVLNSKAVLFKSRQKLLPVTIKNPEYLM